MPLESYDEAQNSETSCQVLAFIRTAFIHAAMTSLQNWFTVKGSRTSLTILKLGHVSPFSEFTENLKKNMLTVVEKNEIQNVPFCWGSLYLIYLSKLPILKTDLGDSCLYKSWNDDAGINKIWLIFFYLAYE